MVEVMAASYMAVIQELGLFLVCAMSSVQYSAPTSEDAMGTWQQRTRYISSAVNAIGNLNVKARPRKGGRAFYFI